MPFLVLLRVILHLTLLSRNEIYVGSFLVVEVGESPVRALAFLVAVRRKVFPMLKTSFLGGFLST